MRTKSSTKSAVSSRRGRVRLGFTLIEVAFTTAIIGVGTTAMMALMATGTTSNQAAARLTQAVDLANDIHELCDQLPFANSDGTTWGIPTGHTISQLLSAGGNLSWLDGQTLSPPVDSTFAAISGMNGWSQKVAVNSVNSGNVTVVQADQASNPTSRVTVTVAFNGNTVFQTSWLAVK
jgi:prepilin-type N-terminal cleavage/methylation domain-containing protein